MCVALQYNLGFDEVVVARNELHLTTQHAFLGIKELHTFHMGDVEPVHHMTLRDLGPTSDEVCHRCGSLTQHNHNDAGSVNIFDVEIRKIECKQRIRL